MGKFMLLIASFINIHYALTSPGPIKPDIMEPYRCRIPDGWCTWVDYGWKGEGPVLLCAVEEGFECGGRVTTTVTVTVTEYASMPTSSLDLPPIQLKAPLESLDSEDLDPIGVGGLLPIPQPDGKFRSNPVYRNTTRPPLRTVGGYKDVGWLPTSTTTNIESEKLTTTEKPMFPSITQSPGVKHELDVIGTDKEDSGPKDDEEIKEIEADITTHTPPPTHTEPPELDPFATMTFPTKPNAKSRLHDFMPFTTTMRREDSWTKPSFPDADEDPMAVLEISCLVRSRVFYSDFKITWGPSWDDRGGCRRLKKAMDRRGVTTGWRCRQMADPVVGYVMEASGHRPMSPAFMVDGAVREAFAGNILYYRGYETAMLCERPG